MNMYSSVDYWYAIVAQQCENAELIETMYKVLKFEQPRILSVIGERWCNRQCLHCGFQKEKSSAKLSRKKDLTSKVSNIASQMGKDLYVVHEGRTFSPSHLEWLIDIKRVRPDCKVGIIDNGSYTKHIEAIEVSGFKFDWMDISLDGTEEIHNKQRISKHSFAEAMNGIRNANRILISDGKINSLLTLTKKNYGSILETSKILPEEISQWHITTITPLRPEIAHLSVSDEEFGVSWRQIRIANQIRSVHFRIYVADDLLKIAKAVGKDKFLAAFENAYVDLASISFNLCGVQITFYPQSVAPSETWVVDADGSFHVPYSIGFTLEELQRGVSRFGEDIRKYIIKDEGEKNFQSIYEKAVEHWRNEFGLKSLMHEKFIFDQIRNL